MAVVITLIFTMGNGNDGHLPPDECIMRVARTSRDRDAVFVIDLHLSKYANSMTDRSSSDS